MVFRHLDRVIAVNQEIAELLLRYGLPPDKVRLISPWSPPHDVSDVGLAPNLKQFFARHAPVLLTVSGLEPEYDLPIQIEVLGGVRKHHPGAGLVIIGSGSLEEELRRAILSKPYAEHILLCGDVPHLETLAANARCDVFLRTSLYDGDSVAIREALHFGTPVIATDNGMRPRGVVLVPPRNEGQLLDAIEECLQAASLHGPRGGSPSDQGYLEPILDLYQELLASG